MVTILSWGTKVGWSPDVLLIFIDPLSVRSKVTSTSCGKAEYFLPREIKEAREHLRRFKRLLRKHLLEGPSMYNIGVQGAFGL